MSFENISLNEYNAKFQGEGDSASEIFGSAASQTWDHEGVQILNVGNNPISTITIPKGFVGLVHSTMGNNEQVDVTSYSASVLENLLTESDKMGAQPWAFACCVDANSSDPIVAHSAASTLATVCQENCVAYMNGEYAILGNRVSAKYKLNIAGMMLSIIPENKTAGLESVDKIHSQKRLFMNSDGVGTKPEFSERLGIVGPAVMDSVVMKADDAARVGSRILHMHDFIELSHAPNSSLLQSFKRIAEKTSIDAGFNYRLDAHDSQGRFLGFAGNSLGHNVSGNVIGELDEELYKRLNSFSAGDFLVAYRSTSPNPRSNGISARRTFMEEFFGKEYHLNPECEEWLKYLSSPSTLLYPDVTELNELGLLTFMTHMSGGALEGKLLSKLAKKNVGAHLVNLPEPHDIDKRMIEMQHADVREGYRSWPMGIDGIVATKDALAVIDYLEKKNYDAYVIGSLEEMDVPAISFKAYDGTEIKYKAL